MTALVFIRPEPGCSASIAAARAMGLAATGHPLFEIRPQPWDAPDPAGFDALLAGSANLFRHGGAALARYRHLPVHVVGDATAEAARAAGFAVAAIGAGTLQPVLDTIPPGTRLLRLSGAERVELTPPADVSLTERAVYASIALPLPADLARLLASDAVVVLHSAAAARHFAAECDRLEIARDRLALACIGPRVAEAAGTGWRTVAVADTPRETALLAKAAELCQTGAANRQG